MKLLQLELQIAKLLKVSTTQKKNNALHVFFGSVETKEVFGCFCDTLKWPIASLMLAQLLSCQVNPQKVATISSY